ncbi:leukocyte immunoglobulin-like receptor subfamily B member 3 [Dromiciops gliroides]|uniref:leukocyte immunoglobulin-like receptor subfamily B member 3 n=1 Tax=Dromiciops gliroides TaxID=33562 RepID=UPI001CC4A0B4|nr:leukocyte immunoglobulin-like receptor subfamily B member 3 [Dromiciops gliroides]
MSPWLPALLCLGLCLSERLEAQDYSLPKPSLWAKPDHVIPIGTRVTFWCQGPPGARGYSLEKLGSYWNAAPFPQGNKASFPLGEIVLAHAGLYRCRYWASSGWSEPSDPLMLIVTGWYAKPVLSAMPSSVVAPGDNVTLHCQSSYGLNGFMMSKEQEDKVTPHYERTLANFSIWAVTAAHGGTYRCYAFDSDTPYVWSAPSEPLVLRVTEPPDEHSLPVTWEPEPPSRTSSPKHSNVLFGLPRLIASILMGLLALIILLFLFLLFFLLRQRSQRQARRKTRDKEAEIKKTLRSSDPAGTPLEETLYAAVKEDRQTEGARQEDTAVPKREDPQEVTYAQLNLTSLRAGAEEPPCSGPVEPSLYAALRAPPGHVWCFTLCPAQTSGPSPTIMTPTLSVLLCLGLCLGPRTRAKAYTPPRPSLRAEKGSLVPMGRSVTLRCRGEQGADYYLLEKKEEYGTNPIMEVKSDETEVEFSIPSVTANNAGTYCCLYRHSSLWSQRSDPLHLVVTGLYDPPSLSALPSPKVASGHNVTLQCQSQHWFDMYALYKDGEEISQGHVQALNSGCQATYHISAVTSAHGGTYRCYTFHSRSPQEWSAPSDPLVLRVTGTFSPSPEPGNRTSGPSSLPAGFPIGVLMGISALLILLFLSLLLLLCHRRRRLRHQTRLGKGGRETEIKKSSSSSDPAGTPLEETLYAAVKEDRQTEGARQEDTAAPKKEDPQEVTYAQLNLTSLRAGAEEPPCSGPVEPSLYAALR